jgi:hypothetical protein
MGDKFAILIEVENGRLNIVTVLVSEELLRPSYRVSSLQINKGNESGSKACD